MASAIDAAALDQIFLTARTHNKWLDRDVPDSLLKELVDVMKMGPTSANCQPARIVFVKSAAAKARLAPFLSEGNRAKTMTAPACAIIGYDLEFYENLPRMFPHNQTAKGWFTGSPAHAEATAFRNGSLQGAYFIVAARALGLDTGPMSGYDQAGVDKEFFPGGKVKSNFLCSVGYGDASAVLGRLPRLTFDEMAEIL
jgi:3-hydroxypropanoate dehydrogenase